MEFREAERQADFIAEVCKDITCNNKTVATRNGVKKAVEKYNLSKKQEKHIKNNILDLK